MTNITPDERIKLFATACDAARLAGSILKESHGKRKEISYKGRINLVTDVDLKSETAIVSIIRESYPDHDIISEETDFLKKNSPYKWIIDPLDGTVNYAHDYPFFCVSIGLEVDGVLEIGVVYNPVMDEFFTAMKGGGAFLNDQPISVSDVDTLEKSFLTTGFSYDISTIENNNLAQFAYIIKRAQAVRRDGSAALNMCYTAMGRFDGYWELKLEPWDIAAGMLIIEEAGGTVSRVDAGKLSPFDQEIVATNGKIHTSLITAIHDAEGHSPFEVC